MNIRTPLARVRGLGSAKSGTQDFWHQRLTALAGIPLTVAAVAIVMSLVGRNYAAVKQILATPVVAIIMLLFIATMIYHMKIGMQVIVEDYVRHEGQKFALLILNLFFSIVIGLASVYAILKLSFGV